MASPSFYAIAQSIKPQSTLLSYLAMTMTNATDFGLLEPRLSLPSYCGMSETNAPSDSMEFLVLQLAPPPYLVKA
jgi:hypothetical protein